MVNIEADMYDFIKDSIRHWVGKNFGSQELEDPSWNIEDLSFHLVKALTKRNISTRCMMSFSLTVYIKEMSDKERANITSRLTEKLERVGGSLASIISSNEKFSEPIEGETHGTKITIKADIPTNRFAVRGLDRWLERQQQGHGTILRYKFLTEDGGFVV